MITMVEIKLGEDGGPVKLCNNVIDCRCDVTFSSNCC